MTKELARKLADAMQVGRIRPENEKDHPSYNKKYDTLSWYVVPGGGVAISEDPYGPCNINRCVNRWVVFDAFGAEYTEILWREGGWTVGKTFVE